MDATIKDFEGAIAELEGIVKKLEEGDLPLEKSLELYERGVQLSRFCHARLEDAERRIEVLNERGELKPAPASLGLLERRGSLSMQSLDEYLSARRAEVEQGLERWLSPSPTVPACRPRGDALQPARGWQTSPSHSHARER